MPVATEVAWEVRPASGSDNNGGGFKAGASGTDYSQQAAAQFALTGVTSAGSGNTVLSASAASTMVGNIGNVISGTNFNTGLFEVTSVSAGVSITFSTNKAGQSISSGVGADGVINIGGAFASVNKVESGITAGNRIFATGSETRTATTTLSASTTPSVSVPASYLVGYTSARNDGGKYTLTLSTNSSLTGFSITGSGWVLQNLTVDGASLTGASGIVAAISYLIIYACKASNFKTYGIRGGSYSLLYANEVTAGASGATAALSVSGVQCVLAHNNVHTNVCPGIVVSTSSEIVGNRVVANTGASSDGINVSWGCTVVGNTVHGNGRHGINSISSNSPIRPLWTGNSLSGNGGWGLLGSSIAGLPAGPWIDGNAYGYPANTSGTRSNADNVTTIAGVGAYTNVWDVTVTDGSQYVDAAGGDFDLNDTALRGALLRAAYRPNTWPGNAVMQSYRDIGASQHIDPAGGSGSGKAGNYGRNLGRVPG